MALVESTAELSVGDEAPDFELPGVDGATHSLAEFGDVDALVVVITCNHCPYAKAKEPALNRLAADFDDLAVVGINPNDDETSPDDSFERMVEYVEAGRIGYDAYLRDESQSVAAAYGAVCTPDPYLFGNDDGTFRLAYHGRVDDVRGTDADADPDREYLREAVEHVLAGEAVPFADEWLPSQGCSIKWTAGNEPDYWDDV